MGTPGKKIHCRVEDIAVITDTGVENLTPQCPLELDDVETLMKGGNGMVQQFSSAKGEF
jgi:hypothetical protein